MCEFVFVEMSSAEKPRKSNRCAVCTERFRSALGRGFPWFGSGGSAVGRVSDGRAVGAHGFSSHTRVGYAAGCVRCQIVLPGLTCVFLF